MRSIWFRAKGPRPKAVLKVLGPDTRQLREDYHWWVPDEGLKCRTSRFQVNGDWKLMNAGSLVAPKHLQDRV